MNNSRCDRCDNDNSMVDKQELNLCNNCLNALHGNYGGISHLEKSVIKYLYEKDFNMNYLARKFKTSRSSIESAVNEYEPADGFDLNYFIYCDIPRWEDITDNVNKIKIKTRVFSNDEIKIIRWMSKSESVTTIAELFRVPRLTTSNAINGHTYKKIELCKSDDEFKLLIKANIDKIAKREYSSRDSTISKYKKLNI